MKKLILLFILVSSSSFAEEWIKRKCEILDSDNRPNGGSITVYVGKNRSNQYDNIFNNGYILHNNIDVELAKALSGMDRIYVFNKLRGRKFDSSYTFTDDDSDKNGNYYQAEFNFNDKQLVEVKDDVISEILKKLNWKNKKYKQQYSELRVTLHKDKKNKKVGQIKESFSIKMLCQHDEVVDNDKITELESKVENSQKSVSLKSIFPDEVLDGKNKKVINVLKD